MTINEVVKFRLIAMPCCRTQICWINPRLPTYCPECGTCVYPEIKNPDHYLVQPHAVRLQSIEKEPNANPSGTSSGGL